MAVFDSLMSSGVILKWLMKSQVLHFNFLKCVLPLSQKLSRNPLYCKLDELVVKLVTYLIYKVIVPYGKPISHFKIDYGILIDKINPPFASLLNLETEQVVLFLRSCDYNPSSFSLMERNVKRQHCYQTLSIIMYTLG